MVAKIFRGAKPADISVEQSARFQLIINLKAAKSIGHEVPAGDHSQQHGSYLLQHLWIRRLLLPQRGFACSAQRLAPAGRAHLSRARITPSHEYYCSNNGKRPFAIYKNFKITICFL